MDIKKNNKDDIKVKIILFDIGLVGLINNKGRENNNFKN